MYWCLSNCCHLYALFLLYHEYTPFFIARLHDQCNLLHKVLQRIIKTLKVFSLFDKCPKCAFLLTFADVYIFLPVSRSDSQTVQLYFILFSAQRELTAGPPKGQFLPRQHMILLSSRSQPPHLALPSLSTSCL